MHAGLVSRDGSEENHVAVEGIESAPPWHLGDAVAEAFGELPVDDRALDALERGVESGRGLVLLDGPEGAGKSSGLRELERRLWGRFQVLLVAGGEAASPEALGLRVLATLGGPQGGDPQRDVRLRAERLRTQGRPLVLLVDDAEALSDATVRWLAHLAEPPEPLARVVLVAREYAVFLEALSGIGALVDLVRLDPRAAPRAPRGSSPTEPPRAPREPEPTPDVAVREPEPTPDVAVREPEPTLGPPAPQQESQFATAARSEPPLPLEPTRIPEPAFEPAEQAADTAAPGAAPSAAPRRDGLFSVEDLLSDAEEPVWDVPSPEPDAGIGRAADTGDAAALRAPLHARETEPAPHHSESPPALPPPKPAPGPRLPLHPTPTASRSRAPTPQPGPSPTPRLGPWLVSGLAAAVTVAWLALPAFEDRPTSAVSAPARSARSPKAIPPETSFRAARREHPSAGPVAARPREARAAAPAAVLDLRQALEFVADGAEGDSLAAALRFLRERGPDSEGYALLDEFDALRPRGPGEAVEVLSARARLRAALCAAWADDVRGEAPARLGCPGAESPAR
jgi:hypothetical protein